MKKNEVKVIYNYLIINLGEKLFYLLFFLFDSFYLEGKV